jgi:hypothetical protein
MKTILQIRTRPNDELADQAAKFPEPKEFRMEIMDLTGDGPDYDALLEAIFRADHIQVW